jgi:hypothetical protein
MIDDNFHYMKEEERLHFGTFSTAEEAVADSVPGAVKGA